MDNVFQKNTTWLVNCWQVHSQPDFFWYSIHDFKPNQCQQDPNGNMLPWYGSLTILLCLWNFQWVLCLSSSRCTKFLVLERFFSLTHFLTILLFEHCSDIICHRPIHPHPWHLFEEFAMEDAEVGLLCWKGGCCRCWAASHTSWIVLGMCFVLMGLTFAILSWNLA